MIADNSITFININIEIIIFIIWNRAIYLLIFFNIIDIILLHIIVNMVIIVVVVIKNTMLEFANNIASLINSILLYNLRVLSNLLS